MILAHSEEVLSDEIFPLWKSEKEHFYFTSGGNREQFISGQPLMEYKTSTLRSVKAKFSVTKFIIEVTFVVIE